MKEQIVSESRPSIEVADQLVGQRRFAPHPALRNAHAQTIAGTLVRRRFSDKVLRSEPRLFETAPGVKVLAHCSWQQSRTKSPVLILIHGLEGSTGSRYMLGTADKAVNAGFNVIRLNMRNCGGTEHLSPTLYHAGLTEDLASIVNELIEADRLRRIYLGGYSLGGNVVLKFAGERGATVPAEVRGVVGVSPSIDLAVCADAIERRSNSVYSLRFVWSLRSRLRRKARLYPNRYDLSRLRGAWTIRKYDDAYVAPHWGFRDVADYYERASAVRVIDRITVPSLIVHAQDDPFIPFAQFQRSEVAGNANITMLAPQHGGHVGFVSGDCNGEERFWAERMAVEFVSALERCH
ncbi:MAG TPA: alpha/beta fold hydrolase [Blastocatellia bacterium]|nr:alpha/beta fold hydrolase [Blastocatellia bacterium]